MINPTREQVAVALFSLLNTSAMQSVFKTISRRPVLWDAAPTKPSLYMGAPQEYYVYTQGTAAPPLITLDFDIFVYIDSGEDPNVAPDTQLNNCIDAIETAIAPPAFNQFKQTLGGIVDRCWIEGEVHRAPGYLDGKGMALFTIKVLVPSG